MKATTTRSKLKKSLSKSSADIVNLFVNCWLKMMLTYYSIKTNSVVKLIIPIIKYGVKLLITYLLKALIEMIQKMIV